MDHAFLSAFVMLLLVLDPFGALPIFIPVMSGVAAGRRARVALRESVIAFVILWQPRGAHLHPRGDGAGGRRDGLALLAWQRLGRLHAGCSLDRRRGEAALVSFQTR